jgi:hypothetical protein
MNGQIKFPNRSPCVQHVMMHQTPTISLHPTALFKPNRLIPSQNSQAISMSLLQNRMRSVLWNARVPWTFRVLLREMFGSSLLPTCFLTGSISIWPPSVQKTFAVTFSNGKNHFPTQNDTFCTTSAPHFLSSDQFFRGSMWR